ncbi:hypothetical protein QFW80_04560 [Luteimonas sp. M1R5S18]|uniref:Uncharacterized protein n=1 Tax=Luteimonas rhizosphaericola TaxID=3042024 RepID=A0ABT6JGI0_9GAMM|nr:hypothetical protein [Luteimonas rhizosphaericola]MDH5829790.1 hypothetical protein [Luteimonas rhizosphaericola]
MNRRRFQPLTTRGKSSVAKAPQLNLEAFQAMAAQPGGIETLKRRREELRRVHAEQQERMRAQFAESERILRDLDLAIDGGISA